MSMTANLIGLYSPAAGSGKTTLALGLRGHGYVRCRFADPLKAMLSAFLTHQGEHPDMVARMLDGDEAKDALLKQLIADHEPAYAAQWRALPESYAHGMLNGIVAFELKILDLKTKVKINQHRPESHAAMHAAYAQGGDQEQALAQWMQRLGMVG